MPLRAVSPRSWHATSAALRTPALACLILFGALGVAELAARTSVARAVLQTPSLGSPSRRFEMQFDGLERFAQSGVDCIVLGNSTALMGVDPAALSDAYRKRTGRALRCFNFGVSGMSASGAEAVAPILLARYRPSLLVYVVTARDLGDSVDGPLLADTPWVQYQRGRFSASGWLVEHSAAFRYYLLYRQWLDPMRWPAATSPSGTTAGGYFPVNAGLPLSPELWAHTQNAYAAGADRLPSDVEIDGLEKLLHLAGRATQIVVVEAPLHVRVQRWVRHAGHFYADAVAQIRRTTQRQRIPFWRLAGWRVIPADGWMDFVHLNRLGATRFSEWLGERIAAAVDSGRLRGPGEPTRA